MGKGEFRLIGESSPRNSNTTYLEVRWSFQPEHALFVDLLYPLVRYSGEGQHSKEDGVIKGSYTVQAQQVEAGTHFAHAKEVLGKLAAAEEPLLQMTALIDARVPADVRSLRDYNRVVAFKTFIDDLRAYLQDVERPLRARLESAEARILDLDRRLDDLSNAGALRTMIDELRGDVDSLRADRKRKKGKKARG